MADKKRIHPSFSMTGRSTAGKPAMQRLPLRTQEAREIQEAMREPIEIPADFETLELRMAATLAETRERGVTVDWEWIREWMQEMQDPPPESPED